MIDIVNNRELSTVFQLISNKFKGWANLEAANRPNDKAPNRFEISLWGLNNVIKKYNNLDIDHLSLEERELLRNTVALKRQCPHLATIEEILIQFRSEYQSHGLLRETEAVDGLLKSLESMSTSMHIGDKLVGDLTKKAGETPSAQAILDMDAVHPEAMTFQTIKESGPEGILLGELIHVYEEYLARIKENGIGPEINRKDILTDTILEICAVYDYSLLDKFMELGWYEGYDHLSPKLRKMIGVN